MVSSGLAVLPRLSGIQLKVNEGRAQNLHEKILTRLLYHIHPSIFAAIIYLVRIDHKCIMCGALLGHTVMDRIQSLPYGSV